MKSRRRGGVNEEAAILATNNSGVIINNNVITKNKVRRLLFSPIVLIFFFTLTFHIDPHTTAHRPTTSKCVGQKKNHTHHLVNYIHKKKQMQRLLISFV